MTDRAEIERLLNMTGRTLEGLPTEAEYMDAQSYGVRCEEIDKALATGGFDATYPCMMHQSDVIELLVSALRDALAKVPKWISVEERLPEPYQCVIVHVRHTEKWRSNAKPEEQWHVVEEDTWLGNGWENNADEDIHEITHWMQWPEPPKEGE